MCITIISIAALPFAYSLIFTTHLHRQAVLLVNIIEYGTNQAEGGGIEPHSQELNVLVLYPLS